MARTEIHLDAMLRHLGAAYYESLHGRASRTDVTRALNTVEEFLAEQERRRPAGSTAPAGARRPRQAGQQHRLGRWQRRVRDVMTTSVVTVDRITPYKEITRLLTEHRISGVPVLTMGRHVAGVVSEADLLLVEDEDTRRAHMGTGRRRWPGHRPRQWGLTAGELMTSPAVTIHPDATIPGAARVMNARHLRRLPVVDPDGKLLGIISRRDLLSVFLRPDPDIAADVRELVDDVVHGGPGVTATVREGVVILTGTPEMADEEFIPLVIRLIWNIDGVVDVVNRLGRPQPGDAHAYDVPAQPAPGTERVPGDQMGDIPPPRDHHLADGAIRPGKGTDGTQQAR